MTKALLDRKDFKLGLFSANCSSGLAVTKAPDRWSGSWDDNLRMAKIADEIGIDFLLPIARWIGYGADTNFHEGVRDPQTRAAGLLASTERISVFATVHTAFNHPIVVAKQLATIDQIKASARNATSDHNMMRPSGLGGVSTTSSAAGRKSVSLHVLRDLSRSVSSAQLSRNIRQCRSQPESVRSVRAVTAQPPSGPTRPIWRRYIWA